MRVLVIGGGVVGLSTAWALAKVGHEPLLFEAGPLPNPGGASHDQHRLIRSLYGAERGYACMVGAAYGAWDRLWADLGRRHYVEAGALGISLQPPESPGNDLAASLTVQRDLKLDHDLLDARQLSDLCPYFQIPDSAWGLLSRPGGILLADKIVAHLAGWLRREGVDLFAETRAIDIDPEAGAVRLADGQIALGDAIVVAAGAWTGKLVPALAERQTPQRQLVVFLAPPQSQAAAWAQAPAIAQFPTALDSYGCPPVAGTRLKLGALAARRACDPDALTEGSTEEAEALFAPFREILTEGADYRVTGYKTCPYAVSHEEDRFLTHREGCLTAITGCTGHMFKFGALMGERLAATATGELAFESFARWAAGEEIPG
ncbi:NAD(P)/FAD-dependent oxidoreductase [Algihabitans sp.]|uniref:NAD(P)/FAD-dependent oxidoreductase n=1 Tax=Algihabitans sp. TaxID=2821514 RepID=UPI003BAB112F